MGFGKLNIWIREPDDCTVSEVNGYAWAKPCCARNRNLIYQTPINMGHAEIQVPPGCYIVDAIWVPGCCGTAKETIAIVNCGDTVCVNLIREYAGDPSGARLASLINHAREAKIPEADIQVIKDAFEKIAKVLPKGKVGRLTQKEFDLKRSVSDDAHKKILSELQGIIIWP
ncbi:MAG: hypothetical protein PHW87_11700 [Methanothrix sp.]|nr:hypothetical protein [Methanothrix sp.]